MCICDGSLCFFSLGIPQAEAERRRAEFAQLLEEHAELVTTVTKLERVAVIVSKSCAEALAQQEQEQQPPPPNTDSQKSK